MNANNRMVLVGKLDEFVFQLRVGQALAECAAKRVRCGSVLDLFLRNVVQYFVGTFHVGPDGVASMGWNDATAQNRSVRWALPK